METSVVQKFTSYPEHVREKLLALRAIIFDVAKEDKLGKVEETLKWGEPSYRVNSASPIRIDWKPKFPDQYAVYFICKTSLVETFKELYGDTFKFEGNRAIVFNLPDSIPVPELKHCISMSLRYHKLKHLPLLGA